MILEQGNFSSIFSNSIFNCICGIHSHPWLNSMFRANLGYRRPCLSDSKVQLKWIKWRFINTPSKYKIKNLKETYLLCLTCCRFSATYCESSEMNSWLDCGANSETFLFTKTSCHTRKIQPPSNWHKPVHTSKSSHLELDSCGHYSTFTDLNSVCILLIIFLFILW